MYYACINNNTVENVIIAELDFIETWDSGYELVIECDSDIGIGFTYSDTNGFQPPYVDNSSEEIIDAEVIEPVKEISAPSTTVK